MALLDLQRQCDVSDRGRVGAARRRIWLRGVAPGREDAVLAMAARGVVAADDARHRSRRCSSGGHRRRGIASCSWRVPCSSYAAAGLVFCIREIGSRCLPVSAMVCSSTSPSPRCSNGCQRSDGAELLVIVRRCSSSPPPGSSAARKRTSFCAIQRGTIIRTGRSGLMIVVGVRSRKPKC